VRGADFEGMSFCASAAYRGGIQGGLVYCEKANPASIN